MKIAKVSRAIALLAAALLSTWPGLSRGSPPPGRGEVLGEPRHLYVLEKGLVAVRRRILITNDVWGEDQVLLYSPALLSTHRPAFALTFTQAGLAV